MNGNKITRSHFLGAFRAAVFVMVFFVGCRAWSLAGEHGLRVTVVHVNDTHAHLAPVEMGFNIIGMKVYTDVGGFPRLAAKVSSVRKNKQHSLVLHAGDVFQGTLYFTKYKGMASADLMNFIGFDAMVVGNHEFDKGSEVLARFIESAQFPVIAANLGTTKDPLLHGLIAPYVIKHLGGYEVAIVGLVAQETPFISSPDERLVFKNPIETAKNTIAMLASHGINKIIVLSHMGYEKDIKLAESVDGIDLVVGGHSHTLLGNFDGLGLAPAKPYPTLIRAPSGQNAFVVHAWKWLKVVGVLNVVFNDNGVVTKCEGAPVILSGRTFWKKNRDGCKIPLNTEESARILTVVASMPSIEVVPEDRAALKKLAPYDNGLGGLKSQFVATVANDLLHKRMPGRSQKGYKESIFQGSHIAPIVAEAMLWKAQSSGHAVQVVVQNAGGVRADIPRGDLTAARVYEVLPFENTLQILQLTGRHILDALEAGISRGGGAFPYIAGVRFKIDMGQGRRNTISSAEIKTPEGQWVIFDEKAQYLVCTNNYLASGGDGYKIFKDKAAYRYDTGLVDAEVFIEYARYLKTLHRPAGYGVTFAR